MSDSNLVLTNDDGNGCLDVIWPFDEIRVFRPDTACLLHLEVMNSGPHADPWSYPPTVADKRMGAWAHLGVGAKSEVGLVVGLDDRKASFPGVTYSWGEPSADAALAEVRALRQHLRKLRRPSVDRCQVRRAIERLESDLACAAADPDKRFAGNLAFQDDLRILLQAVRR